MLKILRRCRKGGCQGWPVMSLRRNLAVIPALMKVCGFSLLETAEAGGMRAWCDLRIVQSQSRPIVGGVSRIPTNSPEKIERIWISRELLISIYFAKTIR